MSRAVPHKPNRTRRRAAVTSRAAVGICVRHVDDTRQKRAESAPLRRATGGERKRSEGPPVESAEKSNKAVALSVVARDLHRRFHGFGAGVAKRDTFWGISRRDFAIFSASCASRG